MDEYQKGYRAGFAEGHAAGMGAEREDELAFLARKRAVAATIAGNDAASEDSRDQARAWVRLLDVLTDDLRAGMHLGLGSLMAALERLPDPAPEDPVTKGE